MSDTKKIIRSSRYIILLGCSCFFIYLVFLLVSYLSAINRLERQFEESTFPKLTELIDHRIDLFFKPTVKGLSLLSETLDWQHIMHEAALNPKWLKSSMNAWAAELEINSVGVSDRGRKIVWDYWSDKPVILDPGLTRDQWFFDFWKKENKPDWTFTLYSEDLAKDYQMYIDRLIRDKSGRPIGSIAAQVSLARLRDLLLQIIGEGERVIILDDKANAVIDISRMEIWGGVKIFRFEDSSIKESSKNTADPLIKKILSQADDFGHFKTDNRNIFYKRTPLFNGSMSTLTVMDTSYQLMKERNQFIKDLIVLFASSALFIGGMLITMMLFTQNLKSLAIRLKTDKSKFEDLLFIITHSFANEILLLQKSIADIPNRISTEIYLRLCEMSLVIQNSVNAARLDSSKSLIITKSYDFSWQWEKLTGNFRSLSEGKGQTFTASPAVDCTINNDEEMVYQILANLVSNAIKYAPKNGEIKLDAMVTGDYLLIIVGDSGPGFSPEDREELFIKFKRLSAKPSGGERSIGLGLYIVKQLADACSIELTLSTDEAAFSGSVWEVRIKIDQSGI